MTREDFQRAPAYRLGQALRRATDLLTPEELQEAQERAIERAEMRPASGRRHPVLTQKGMGQAANSINAYVNAAIAREAGVL